MIDLRFKRPNAGDDLGPAAAHAIERPAATFLRGHAVYFGPMGCLTSLFDDCAREDAAEEIRRCFCFFARPCRRSPGRGECGDWIFYGLAGAKRETERYCCAICRLDGRSARLSRGLNLKKAPAG